MWTCTSIIGFYYGSNQSMVATGIFQQRGKVPTGKNLPWGNFPEENVNFESLKWYSQHFEDTMCQKTIVFNSHFQNIGSSPKRCYFSATGALAPPAGGLLPLPSLTPLALPLDWTCKIDMQTERSLKIYHVHFGTTLRDMKLFRINMKLFPVNFILFYF